MKIPSLITVCFAILFSLISCRMEPSQQRPTVVPPTPLPKGIALNHTFEKQNGNVIRLGVGIGEQPIWSKDGKLIVLPTSNGIYVYDAETLETKRHLFSPTQQRNVAISPDSKWVVSSDVQGKEATEVWNIETGDWVRTIGGGKNVSPANRVVFGTNKIRAVVSGNGWASVWDVSNGERIYEWRSYTSNENWMRVSPIRVSPNEEFIAQTSGAFKLFKIGHEAAVVDVGGVDESVEPTFSPDSKYVLYGDRYKSIVVVDTASGKTSKTLVLSALPYATATGLTYTKDNKKIMAFVSAQKNGDKRESFLRIWDSKTFDVISDIPMQSIFAERVILGIDETHAFIFTGDQKVLRLNLATKQVDKTYDTFGKYFELSPNSKEILTYGFNTLKIWDVDSGKLLRALNRFEMQGMSNPVFSADGEQVLLNNDTTLYVSEFATGKVIQALSQHKNQIECIAVSADGKWAASVSDDGELLIWDAKTYSVTASLQTETRGLFSELDFAQKAHAMSFLPRVASVIGFSPDSQNLAIATQQGNVHVFDVTTARLISTMRNSDTNLDPTSFAFLADGKSMLITFSGYQRSETGIWEFGIGIQKSVVAGLSTNHFALSNDEMRLLSVEQGTLKLRYYPSLVEKHNLGLVESDSARVYAFSPDKRFLAIGRNKVIELWNVATGSFITKNESHTGKITSLSFSSDSTMIISTSQAEGTVYIWRLNK